MTDFLTKEWWQQATLADVKAKIAAGENINARDKAGFSPLILAASYSTDTEIIKTLLENGAELDAKDWITGSVLANAAKYNPHPEIIKLLVQSGADVNEEDISEEMTPLMQAAQYNPNPKIIKTLLESNADAGMHDEHNKTAFDYFERAEEYPEIKKLLEVKEIDIENINEKSANTILTGVTKHREVSIEDKKIVKIRRAISELLQTLTPREERVLRMHFGIGMNTEMTLEEIAATFNVTCERVRQIEAKALRKMMHPERWQKIQYLPYNGNSSEERFLLFLHLLISKCRELEEKNDLHIGNSDQ